LSTGVMILLIVLGVFAAILVVLYFVGKKMKKRQEEQQAQLDAMAQTMSILVIDKKLLRMKNAGLPPAVLAQAPRIAKLSKMPIVKAKVGPKVMSFICDNKVYDQIPLKRECKVVVSGLYITAIKSARGGLEQPKKKQGFFRRHFGASASK